MAVRFCSTENKCIDSRHNSRYGISRRSVVMGTRTHSVFRRTTQVIEDEKEKASMLIGGIEAGGTKMVCAIGETDGSLETEVKIVDRISVPTQSPEETLPEMI